jgi:endonuclease I
MVYIIQANIMNKRILLTIFTVTLAIFTNAQIVITNTATPYTQDFNTLNNSGTSTVLPTGWLLNETGTSANTTYGADNGGSNSGNTYSYGSTAATERAFGGLQSGSVIPTIGVAFTNNSGTTITSITVNYTGEQWRAGIANRTVADTLNFQYSTDATSINTGTWIDENSLDFASPTLNVAAGALDGNAAVNRTAKTFTINGLNIAAGSTFYFRWTDFNITSSDDGLAIDDITINFSGTVIPPCSEPAAQPTNLVLTPTPTTISGSFTAAVPDVDEYLVVRSTSATLSATPADGTTYTIGQALGGGTVIAFSSATTFTDINLTPNTTYYYFIFSDSSDACAGAPNYLITNPLTLSTATLPLPACVAPGSVPGNLALSPANTTITGSFTAASGANRYLVVRSLSNSLSASPVNGTTYTSGQAFGGGTVVSYTAGTSFSASGLTANTTYYFFVFAANGDCSGEPFYNTTSLNGNATTTNSSGGIPAGYYDAATGLTCQPLKTALKNIISTGAQALSYTPGIWNAYFYTERRRNDANTADIIWDMYTDLPTGSTYTNGTSEIEFAYGTNQCGGAGYTNEGDCYNREHSFPQSWFANASPMVSDLHHIFGTDGKVNGIRNNFPYGEVNKANTSDPQYYKSKNESYRGAPTATMGYSGATVFEPIDFYKGDFARAQFYMATRYEDQVNSWSGNGNANEVLLSPTDEPDAAKRKLQVFDTWQIRLLYKWHLQDPVSQKEVDRNNVVYYQDVTDGAVTRRQGNRNPFIDHPEYVALIWQCSNAIPVTITDFAAARYGNNISLTWYATRETNFKQYEVQRSTDGINFTVIGTIAGRNLANYNFIDDKLPAVKTVYYRLKMLDIDGQFSYSKTVALRLNGFSGVFVFPNPTSSRLTVQLQDALPTDAVMLISDMTGRVLRQYTMAAQQVIIGIDASQLPSGRYFIKIKSRDAVLNQSFNVIR